MTTVDLREKDLGVQELLSLAEADSVLIIAKDGHGYTLEGADDLEREVAELGASRNFMSFLEERGKEDGAVSLEEIRRRLGRKTPDTSVRPSASGS